MAVCGGDVRRSWSGTGCQPDISSSVVPASEEEKPRKRRKAFCLARIKSRNSSGGRRQQQQHQPAANNNNMPFMIHCQIGKEIKHICSNCRGVEPLDGCRLQHHALVLQRMLCIMGKV